MAEFLTLTTPVSRINTKWSIDYITFDWTGKSITVRLKGDNDEYFFHTINDAEALLLGLNKADLRTNTLQKRIFTKLQTEGLIIGNVTGTPD